MTDRIIPKVADGAPINGDLVAVIDESSPGNTAGGITYVVAIAALFEPTRAVAELSQLFTTDRRRPFHWEREGTVARSRMIEIAAEIGVVATAHYSHVGRRGQARARQAMLRRMVVESRSPRTDRWRKQMADSPVHPDSEQSGVAPDRDAIVAELGELRERIDGLCAELDQFPSTDDAPAPKQPAGVPTAAASPASTRRQLLQLAGASAIGVAGGAIVAGQPVAAADPNDVVKNISNPVSDTTTLDGAFPGPVLSLFNRSGSTNARGLYVISEGAQPALRADNARTTTDAVVLAGNAPAGRDLHAMGSGRIAMEDHDFGGGNEYFAGELHQSGGTFYAMVHDGFRRVLAAPEAAGALFAIDPIRVYDSRLPTPLFGPLAAGQSRTVDINHARDRATGSVVQSGVVPEDATAIVFNLTAAQTLGRGFLSVTPETTTDPDTSTINWSTDDASLPTPRWCGSVSPRASRCTAAARARPTSSSTSSATTADATGPACERCRCQIVVIQPGAYCRHDLNDRHLDQAAGVGSSPRKFWDYVADRSVISPPPAPPLTPPPER